MSKLPSKKKTIRDNIITGLILLFALVGIVTTLSYFVHLFKIAQAKLFPGTAIEEDINVYVKTIDVERPEIDVQLLTINPYSRPGIAISGVKNVVIHYTANPGSTAQQNRDYFEGLKDRQELKVSSHFIIGLDGEIIQCIPTSEISYASNNRNGDTVSIECCHPDKSGKFTKKTYNSLVWLSAFICAKYDLSGDDLIRHYDVSGKLCPKYFVENEDKWLKLKADVNTFIKERGSKEFNDE
ncbi:MAG: peptidoglycan recognition protein family protein [Lachnospiraceae bacterium]|nr:peptidoglycan recognition protein family protein [Lachnospiraceae bacterium]